MSYPITTTSNYPWKFSTFLFPSTPFRRRSSIATTTSSGQSSTADNRRSSSFSSTSSASDTTAASASPSSLTTTTQYQQHSRKPGATYLSGHQSLLRCARCLTHVCPTSSIISKGFTGRHGRAYLVSAAWSSAATQNNVLDTTASLPNVAEGTPERRTLVTGQHTVANITCSTCGGELGWRYVAAQEEEQRYKVGKYILETKRVVRAANWEEDEDEDHELVEKGGGVLGGGFGKKRGLSRHGDTDDEHGEVLFDSQDEEECEDLFMGIWSEKLALKRRRDKMWRDM